MWVIESFYEMLTGDLPMGRFALPSQRVQIDVRLDEIVLKALEKEPARRYQQASEVKTQMESISRSAPPEHATLASKGPSTPSPDAGRPTQPDGGTTGWPVGTIMLCGLIMLLSFMPWGNAGKAGFTPQYRTIGRWELGIVPLEKDVTAWDSSLALKPTGNSAGHWYFRIPNWILPVNALVILALASVRGARRNLRQFWVVALAAFGAAFMFLVVHAMVFHGYHDLAGLGVVLLFIALFLKSTIELILAHLRMTDEPPQPAQARSAAAWLLVSSIAGLLPLFWAGWFFKSDSIFGVLTSLIVVVGVPVSLLIGVGSLRMFARPSSRFARLCGVLAMLPCYAGVVIGLPAGIYALWVRNRPAAAAPPTAVPRGPRFSRAAILGAVWALFGLLSIVPILFFIGLNRVWNGTAQPTDLIHEAPPAAFTIFMGALLVIGAGAPIGTTILGIISIGNIKRSAGKLLGLPLAFADAVFFPLLLLDVLLCTMSGAAIAFLEGKLRFGHIGAGEVMLLESLLALVGDFLIVRALWCKVNPPTVVSPEAKSQRETNRDGESGPLIQNAADGLIVVAATALLTAVCIGVGLGILYMRDGPSVLSISRPNMIGPNPLIGMAVVLFNYALFLGVAGIQMRRMRWRLFVLLCTMIGGLFVPIMLLLNVVMERVAEWPALIPVWLGLPVAVWVLKVLFRPDVRAAFAKAGQTKPTTEL